MRFDIRTVSRKVRLILAALSVLLVAVTLASAQPKTPFTGVWETVAGSATRYSVRLTQVGNRVTGTYLPHNGKIFGGVVVGNKVTFKWTQEGGYEGTGEFTLDDDGKGFTGTATATKPVPQTHPWNTYKPAPPESFAGAWDLVNNIGVRIPLTIDQKGAQVTGIYPAQNGKLEGTVDGKNLRFTWESDKGSGSGEFNISSSGATFGGTFFNKGVDPKVAKPVWEGWGERKTVTNSTSNAGKVPGPAAQGPVSFTGCWRLSGGLISGQTICLKQDEGGRVTDGDRFEGTINGNTLRFTEGDSRSGRLIMDKGGKSFRGFWHSGNDTELDELSCTGIMVHKPLGSGIGGMGGKAIASFAGAWTVVEGGMGGGMEFVQSGPVVTGVYGTHQGSYTVYDGHVDGNTLRFTLIGRRGYAPVSAAVLVMDTDGKSFKGTINGVPVTGTFAHP